MSGKNAQPSIYANEYSFSTFIYIDNDTHNGSTDPIIFYKGKPENKHLDVKLDKSVNKFIVTYNGQDCSVEMIPIGRWFHFATVLRDQSVDIYIDSKLKRHCYFAQKARDINVSEQIVINPDYSQIENFANVKVSVSLKNETGDTSVTLKLIRTNRWKIYDLDYQTISIVGMEKMGYDSKIKRQGIEKLVQKMLKKS